METQQNLIQKWKTIFIKVKNNNNKPSKLLSGFYALKKIADAKEIIYLVFRFIPTFLITNRARIRTVL